MRGAALALALPLLAACGEPAKAPATKKNALKHADESWCPDGFESGPNDTCFAIPEHPPKDASVLLYVHGVISGRGAPNEWKAVRSAVDKGFPVVLVHGKRRFCAWSKESSDQFCWPQDPEDPSTTKGVVGEWDKVLWQVEALLEPGTHRRYVLANENGAAFVEMITAQHLFSAQAFALVGGASLAPPEKVDAKAKTKPAPILVSFTTDTEKPKELHDALTKAAWPHAYCPRGGGGAAINAEDVDAALRFFRRDAEGSLRPQNGALSCDAAKR